METKKIVIIARVIKIIIIKVVLCRSLPQISDQVFNISQTKQNRKLVLAGEIKEKKRTILFPPCSFVIL